MFPESEDPKWKIILGIRCFFCCRSEKSSNGIRVSGIVPRFRTQVSDKLLVVITPMELLAPVISLSSPTCAGPVLSGICLVHKNQTERCSFTGKKHEALSFSYNLSLVFCPEWGEATKIGKVRPTKEDSKLVLLYIGMFIDQKSDLKSISIDLRLYQGPMVCPDGQKGYDQQKSGTKTVVWSTLIRFG